MNTSIIPLGTDQMGEAKLGKKWSFNVPGSSGWHNPKIQGQIYPSMLFSQEPVIGLSKNLFPRKSVVKKTILS